MTKTPDKERQLKLLRRKRAILAAREDLIAFTQLMMPDPNYDDDVTKSLYLPQQFHRVIGRSLEEVERGDYRRLMINVGPRFGKTTLASAMFPAWYVGRHPDRSIIVATYNEHYSWDLGRRVRDIMETPEYKQVFPDVEIKVGANAVNRVQTTRDGVVFSVGRGSSITGRGGHCILLDDPIKDRTEADSMLVREKLWTWYNQVLRTRLMDSTGTIVIVQCLTGDTPIMMADGAEKPLQDVRPGDEVATYRAGILGTSTVLNWRSNGPDNVFTIKMTSGKTLRANERHPFLVCENGEPRWVRVRDLRRGHEIFRVNGANGKAKPARQAGVKSLSYAEVIARRTTTRSDGPMGCAPLPPLTRPASIAGVYAAATELLQKIMRAWLPSRMANALFAGSRPVVTSAPIGAASSASITATAPIGYARCSVTTVTSPSDTQRQSKWPWPSPSTYDFTTDTVAEILPAGTEEVFDLQIDETENFISNGYVSHNTRWTEDDLVGRLIDPMNPYYNVEEAKAWRKIDLPALAEDNDILGRKPGEPLWPERFTKQYLEEIRATDPRGFSALYQGKPSPQQGAFFQSTDLVPYNKMDDMPSWQKMRFYGASDHAVSTDRVADKTCLLVVGVDEKDNIWLMPDMVWDKLDSHQTVESMLVLMKKYKPQFWWAEGGAIHKSLGPFLRRRMVEKQVFCAIDPINPAADKQQRAQSIQARCAMKMVHFPTWTRWWADAQDQILKFPHGAKDDFVDALALIGLGLAKMHGRTRNKPPPPDIAKGSFAEMFEQTRAREGRDRRSRSLQGW